ncbi:hypothetical protein HJG39_19120, partial [Alteromonas sp. a30]|nr:hypothetical protein [Alteromonas sp. a30]
YRTEIESLVSVTQSGDYSGAASFTVTLPNGTQRLYGTSASTRVVAAGKTAAMSWLIAREQDVSGNNHMSYSYTAYGDAEHLLTRIKYTGNGTTDGNREVRFEYQNRAKYSTQYLAGGKSRMTKRLHKINTWYAGSKVREYTLGYGSSSAASGRSLLRSVTECGFDGSASICRAPTTFDWLEAAPRFELERFETEDGTEVFPAYQGDDAYNPGTIIDKVGLPRSPVGDINGDGVRDWVGYTVDSSDKLHPITYFMNAEGEQTNSGNTPANLNMEEFRSSNRIFVNGDFNLDGRTDRWIIPKSTGLLLIGYTEDDGAGGFTSNYSGTTAIVMNDGEGATSKDRIESVSDYNGDGWPDIVISRTTENSITNAVSVDYFLHLHTKNLSTPYVVNNTAFLETDSAPNALGTTASVGSDLSGDGIPDIVISRYYRDQYRPVMDTLLITQVSQSGVVSFTSHNINFDAVDDDTVSHYSTLMDVNGDGLDDWVGWIDADYITPSTQNLKVKLNKGDGSFADAINTGYTIPAVLERAIGGPSAGQAPPERYVPLRYNQLRPMDVDNDGKVELLSS